MPEDELVSTEASPGTERAVAEALWAKIASDPSADGPHQAFLSHCAESDQLDEAARRYREAKDELEGEDALREVYDQRLAAIATLALAKLDVEHEPPPLSLPLRIIQVLMLGIAVLSFWMLARALLM